MDNEVLDEAMDSETATESLRELLLQDSEAAKQYLRDSFLTEAMVTLFRARRQADLTQAEVASRLGTKQSAIARWEADFSGKISLRNYVDFALACDVRPLDFTLEPVSDVVQFAMVHPGEAITASAYAQWQAASSFMPSTVQFFSTTYGGGLVPQAQGYTSFMPDIVVQQGSGIEFHQFKSNEYQVPQYGRTLGTTRLLVPSVQDWGSALHGRDMRPLGVPPGVLEGPTISTASGQVSAEARSQQLALAS